MGKFSNFFACILLLANLVSGGRVSNRNKPQQFHAPILNDQQYPFKRGTVLQGTIRAAAPETDIDIISAEPLAQYHSGVDGIVENGRGPQPIPHQDQAFVVTGGYKVADGVLDGSFGGVTHTNEGVRYGYDHEGPHNHHKNQHQHIQHTPVDFANAPFEGYGFGKSFDSPSHRPGGQSHGHFPSHSHQYHHGLHGHEIVHSPPHSEGHHEKQVFGHTLNEFRPYYADKALANARKNPRRPQHHVHHDPGHFGPPHRGPKHFSHSPPNYQHHYGNNQNSHYGSGYSFDHFSYPHHNQHHHASASTPPHFDHPHHYQHKELYHPKDSNPGFRGYGNYQPEGPHHHPRIPGRFGPPPPMSNHGFGFFG